MMSSKTESTRNLSNDPTPEIPIWLMLASLIFVVCLPVAGWFILTSAFNGVIHDLYLPLKNSGDIITVRSFDLAGPMYVLGLIAVAGTMSIVFLARPLRLPQSVCNRWFKPFGWMAIAALFFALLAKPSASAIGSYIEQQEYTECVTLSRLTPFSSTRVYPQGPMPPPSAGLRLSFGLLAI